MRCVYNPGTHELALRFKKVGDPCFWNLTHRKRADVFWGGWGNELSLVILATPCNAESPCEFQHRHRLVPLPPVLTSDSSPSCILQMHVFRRGTRRPSLRLSFFSGRANGVSASSRLGAQLRGDSLISHLRLLFLGCRVIMREDDGQVRNRLYL